MAKDSKHRRFDWLASGFAGIWLIFLAFPALEIYVTPTAGGGAKVASFIALGLFVLGYLLSYGASWLMPGSSPWVKTLRWSLLLLLPVGIMATILGPWILSFTTYFVAMWAFQTPPRIGLTVGSVLTLLTATSMITFFPGVFDRGGYGFVAGAIFVLIMATMSASSDRREERRAQALRAEQAERIASDVHDVLGRSLTVINLKAELAAALATADPQKAVQEMKQVSELSRTALAEVRATVTRLKLPTFAGELAAARSALGTAGISGSLPTAEEAQVAGTNSVLFSWVLREAITNVIRHSAAKNCRVLLEADRLEIIDDGAGASITPGNGLSGLEQRVKESGGDLHIETGVGTRLLVTMNGDTSPLGA